MRFQDIYIELTDKGYELRGIVEAGRFANVLVFTGVLDATKPQHYATRSAAENALQTVNKHVSFCDERYWIAGQAFELVAPPYWATPVYEYNY